MELEFLGTGAGVPAKHRNVSSVALKLLDERNAVWLFDCGEGTQMQILRCNIRPRKIEKIFISHLHGDHIFGLPGLISSRSFQGGTETLTIYGPKGIREFIQTSLKITQTRLAYRLEIIEITAGIIFEDQQFQVSCQKLEHGIECFGFRVVEKDHEGELQVDKLQKLGIKPGPVYGQLKAGLCVTLEDGQVIDGRDFVGESKAGRIVTILGDTRYTPAAIELAKNANVLVHESTYNKHEEKMAHAHFHATTHQAAEVAKKAQVKQLVLTHISARYLHKEALELEKEAQEVFAAAMVAKDFTVVDVPFDKE
ncbi:MAG: ribonuclease Z [Enterococcus sp.]